MTSIGIVGTGIAGLQLALTLQQAGIDTTLYAERTPDEIRGSRLMNTVSRFGATVARERALGVAHWVEDPCNYRDIHVAVTGTPVAFSGRLRQAAGNVDFRVYLAQLQEDYAARGGNVVIGRRSVEQIVAGTADHDLTVVAAGRESVAEFFPRDADALAVRRAAAHDVRDDRRRHRADRSDRRRRHARPGGRRDLRHAVPLAPRRR